MERDAVLLFLPSSSSTTTATTTVHDRVESLLSHRRYGVDNTGNVRVWDAEGTLAGFLLSVVLDDDDECDDGVVVRDIDDDDVGVSEVVHGERTASTSTAIEMSRLKNVLRSLLIRRRSLSSSSSSSYARGDDDSSPTDSCNVLELGAGQAGLAGLAMASVAATTSTSRDEIPTTHGITTMRPLRVVLTDGHPRCVENNGVCARMISSMMRR